MDMQHGNRIVGISGLDQAVWTTPSPQIHKQPPAPMTICEEVTSLSSGLSELISRLHELEARLGIVQPGPCEKLADAPPGLCGVLAVMRRQLNEANDSSINLYQRL